MKLLFLFNAFFHSFSVPKPAYAMPLIFGGTRIDCVVEQLDLAVSGPCNYASVVVRLEVVPEEVGLAWLQVDVQSVEELE